MHAGSQVYDLIREREGLKLRAYKRGKDRWTIGYGHTRGVKEGDECTKEQAEQWLRDDVAEAEGSVEKLVTVELTQGQFDALVDFVFNLGHGRLANSTLLKMLNAGDKFNAARQLRLWVHGPTGVEPGLLVRRAKEEAMFNG